MTRAKDVSKITTDANFSGTLDVTGATTLSNNLSVDGGTIKLDGNYPTATGNVALGDAALSSGSLSGDYNTAVGSGALRINTTGISNLSLGAETLYDNTTGSQNTAVGRGALRFNTTASDNTAIGKDALFDNTTGASNTAVGRFSLANNTTASGNTAVGYQSLLTNTTGIYLTAIGEGTLRSNTTANSNTAVGWGTLYANTTGTGNVGVGTFSSSPTLRYNTTGSSNTAIGSDALANNTTASNNTVVGYQAGDAITTGSNNSAFGNSALSSNISGQYNVAIGRSSLTAVNASFNTGVGYFSGGSLTSGTANVFLGKDSGYLITTGSKNTIIGSYSGNQGGLDIRTASNHIVLSDGDGNPRGIFDNSGNFLVGKTSSDTSVQGAEIRETGFNAFTRDTSNSGQSVLLLNKKNSDGVIQIFQKDTTTVGNIETQGSALIINATAKNLQLVRDSTGSSRAINFGIDHFKPFDSNNAQIDLGTSSGRFRNLYLSGGVYLGGTGSANFISDYEEGTFNTATMAFETSGTVTMSQHLLRYTKIGSVVTVTGNLFFNVVSSQNGPLKIPLPFTSASGTQNRAIGFVGNYETSEIVVIKIENNSSYGTMVTPVNWATHTITNSDTRLISFVYHTDS